MAPIARNDGRIEKLEWLYIDDPASVFQIDGARYCAEVSNKSGTKLRSVEHARDTGDATSKGIIPFK